MGWYDWFLVIMALVALVVFVSLYFVNAGYGVMFSKKWGVSLPNRWGWVLMEAPVFVGMLLLWYFSERRLEPGCLVIFLLFECHYYHRSFIFPQLIKGNSRMPLSIVSMGITFNLLNATMQGTWLFYLAPREMYGIQWLASPQFLIGTAIFFAGMFINIHSDSVIRSLRKPGDQNHYFPKKGMFRYVTSANYFGEVVEWTGFAILCWSWAGAVFAWWTFANLAPRAASIYNIYKERFPQEFEGKNIKRIIPFIY